MFRSFQVLICSLSWYHFLGATLSFGYPLFGSLHFHYLLFFPFFGALSIFLLFMGKLLPIMSISSLVTSVFHFWDQKISYLTVEIFFFCIKLNFSQGWRGIQLSRHHPGSGRPGHCSESLDPVTGLLSPRRPWCSHQVGSCSFVFWGTVPWNFLRAMNRCSVIVL